MDLSRRGFMAAVTSTLATAVPVATALIARPTPKEEPEAIKPEYIEPVRLGACGACEHWTVEFFGSRNDMNRIHGNGRVEGACLNVDTQIGITEMSFGCTLFQERIVREPEKPQGREEWVSLGMSGDNGYSPKPE